jgi:uncharacterized protein YkwD
MRRKIFLLSLFVLMIIACSSTRLATQVMNQTASHDGPQIPVTGPQSFSGCGGEVVQPVDSAFEQAVVEQTNQIRIDNGLPPLKRVTVLDESARYHAADMSVNNYFDHNTFNRINGTLTQFCDTWNRIEFYYKDWQALAENIAAGQNTPEMAMDGWMNSPEHRHNILSDSYSEIGVGFYEGNGEYRYYWDQNFGRRQDIYPLVIDGEKAETHSQTVPVYIYGKWSEMRLRNDQDAWTSWIPFQSSFTWSLPSNGGIHTITAELRGPDGRATTSDTIMLVP